MDALELCQSQNVDATHDTTTTIRKHLNLVSLSPYCTPKIKYLVRTYPHFRKSMGFAKYETCQSTSNENIGAKRPEQSGVAVKLDRNLQSAIVITFLGSGPGP